MSKKKKKKTNLAMRLMGILMLVLMVASSLIGILAYFL